jgi:ABC-type phosphate/phosphonate transport system substrate-binding protein
MYDPPEVRAATDALWRAIALRLRQAGIADVPHGLSRHFDRHEAWRHEGLLLGQACGYPAVTAFKDDVRIVATPIYDAPGCVGATHRSFVVVPASSSARSLADLAGRRFALNSWDSNSGMNLARLAFAPLARGGRFLGEIIETGNHAGSLGLVAGGGADAASIDCVTYALLARHRPALVAAVRVIAETAPGPSLPFVTAHGASDAVAAALRSALAGAVADPALAAAKRALFLAGVAPAEAVDYAGLLDYERRAAAMGYPRLA